MTQKKVQYHKEENAVRHAEKRRTSTCSFADRVASTSVDHYCTIVPSSFRESQRQTCLATIVAHCRHSDTLRVLAMGVGTKFLPNALLQDGNVRVRDCHAEVLCKRAFRRYLFEELLSRQSTTSLNSSTDDVRSIMEEVIINKSGTNATHDQSSTSKFQNEELIQYRLKEGITLHLYCSSAPCGNATLKKFAKMTRETYNLALAPHEWDSSPHVPIRGHAVPLGQFSLLVKLDSTLSIEKDTSHGNKLTVDSNIKGVEARDAKKKKRKPVDESDLWCPPGTSTVTLGKGSIHTCSDKICRWNILGLQGSLLSSFIDEPMYLSTITIARKFTRCICQRALCCRGVTALDTIMGKESSTKMPQYNLHHPSIMGTGVLMDNGVLEMKPVVIEGETVKFASKLAWAWSIDMGLECIDGASGLLCHYYESNKEINVGCNRLDAQLFDLSCIDVQSISKLSSSSFVELYTRLERKLARNIAPEDKHNFKREGSVPCSLSSLRDFKRKVSPRYEHAKDRLLTIHPVFRDWKRRDVRFDSIEKSK